MTPIRYRRDLWRLIEELEGNIAEIGVAEGLFSADMLAWPLAYKPTVYMVDRWACHPEQKGDGGNEQSWHDANYEAAQKRVMPFGSRACPLIGGSVAMAGCVPNHSLALAYIDCDHSYEAVMADIKAWVPKVMPGGYMAFHDFLAPQYWVKEAVTKYCHERLISVHLLPEDKEEDAGAYFQC